MLFASRRNGRSIRHSAILSAAIAAACASSAHAAVFTYTNPAVNSTGSWSTDANWSAAPSSAVTTDLVFTGTMTDGVVATTNNDVATPFQLNSLTLAGAGPATGTASTIIGGSQLQFANNGSVGPTISLTGTGTRGTYVISAPVSFLNDTRITGDGTANFRISGALSGSGNLTKSGTSTLRLTGDSSATWTNRTITMERGSILVDIAAGGRLASTTSINFVLGGTFSLVNATGGTNYTQGLQQVNWTSGIGTLDTNRPGGGNTYIDVANWSRSAGAIAVITTTAGSVGSNSSVRLANGGSPQAAGFVSQGMFYGTGGFAWYTGTATGNVRAIAYGTDSGTTTVAGTFTASSPIATANQHVNITSAISATTSATAGTSGSNTLTLADASNFQVGQLIVSATANVLPTGIARGTYITAKSGNVLTLSNNLTANAAGAYASRSGIQKQTDITLNTLRFNTVGSLRLADSQTLTLSDAGILYDENATQMAAVISGGTGIQPGLNKEFVVNTGTNSLLIIASSIIANGTNAFNKTGLGTVRIDSGNMTIGNGLFVNQGSLTLAAGGHSVSNGVFIRNSGTLTLSQSNTISGGVTLIGGNMSVAAAQTISGGISLTNSSIVRLTNQAATLGSTSNTITADGGTNVLSLELSSTTNNMIVANDIQVLSGTLNINSGVYPGGGAQADARATGNITVNAGASLVTTKGSGNGYVFLGNSGASTLTFGANAGSNTVVTLGGFGSGARTTFAGLITNGVVGTGPKIKNGDNSASTPLQLNVSGSSSANTYEYAGTIEDFTNFTKAGASTQILSGANIYNGITTVNGGTLFVNGSHTAALSNTNSAYQVNSGGTFAGTGTIAVSTPNTVGFRVATGGKLAPGGVSTPGTLTLNMTSTGTSGTLASLDLSATAANNAGQFTFRLGTASDQIVLGPNSFLALGAATANLNSLDWSDFTFIAGPGLANTTYKLIDGSVNVTGGLSSSAGALSGSIGAGGTGTLSIVDGQDLVLTITGLSTSGPTATTYTLNSTASITNLLKGANTDITTTLTNLGGATPATADTIDYSNVTAGLTGVGSLTAGTPIGGTGLADPNSVSNTSQTYSGSTYGSATITPSGTITSPSTSPTGTTNAVVINVGNAATNGINFGTALSGNSTGTGNALSSITSDTEAQVLQITNGLNVTMDWREAGADVAPIVGDVVRVLTTDSAYVLILSYANNPGVENSYFLGTRIPSTNFWTGAGDMITYLNQGTYAGQTTLGMWGNDTGGNYVWAIIDGTVGGATNEFAVIPEPASLMLLGLGAVGLLARRRR